MPLDQEMFGHYQYRTRAGLHVADPQLIEIANYTAELEKARQSRTLTTIEEQIAQQSGALFSLYSNIVSNIAHYGAAEKPAGTESHKTLRQYAKQSIVDSLIINARLFQMQHLARRVIVEGKQKGFAVRHVRHSDKTFKMTPAITQTIREIEDIVFAPNGEVHPSGFRDVLVKLTQGRLIIDRTAIVVMRDRVGRPLSWHVLPPDDIRPRYEVLLKHLPVNRLPGMSPHLRAYRGSQQQSALERMRQLTTRDYQSAATAVFEKFGVDVSEAAYIQEVDGIVTGAWRAGEIIVEATAPSDEINLWNYGISPLERSLEVSAMLIYAINYNRSLFTKNYPEAMLLLHGNVNPLGLETFKCLHRYTKLETDQGVMRIEKIVNRRLPVKVKSYDRETGQIVWAQVIDWQKYRTTEWVRLYYHGGGQFKSIIVTPNHKLWNGRAMQEARYFREGCRLYVQSPTLTQEQRQVILGSLLGDGSLRCQKNKNPYYQESHGLEQAYYLDWKHRTLNNLSPTLIWNGETTDGASEKKHKIVHFTTRSYPVLQEYEELCCEVGTKRKRFSWEWLSQVDALGLAVWFMDDGHFQKQRLQKYVTAGIAMMPATPEELSYVVRYFMEKWGLCPRIHSPNRANSRGWRLSFSYRDTEKLLRIMSPYLTYECLGGTRLGKKWHADYVPIGSEDGVYGTKIVKIEYIHAPNGEYCYDVTVDPTHTFFANRIVSSNSQIYSEVGPEMGAARFPVLSTGNSQFNKAELLKLRDSIKDMEMPQFIRLFTALKTSAFRCHPSLLNLEPDRGGGQTALINNTDEAFQIDLSQEEGLGSLAESLGDSLTAALLRHYEPWQDYHVVPVLDKILSEQEVIELWDKKLKTGGYVVDEMRTALGDDVLEKVSDGVKGTYAPNVFFFQAQQAQQQQSEQELQQLLAPPEDSSWTAGTPDDDQTFDTPQSQWTLGE